MFTNMAVGKTHTFSRVCACVASGDVNSHSLSVGSVWLVFLCVLGWYSNAFVPIFNFLGKFQSMNISTDLEVGLYVWRAMAVNMGSVDASMCRSAKAPWSLSLGKLLPPLVLSFAALSLSQSLSFSLSLSLLSVIYTISFDYLLILPFPSCQLRRMQQHFLWHWPLPHASQRGTIAISCDYISHIHSYTTRYLNLLVQQVPLGSWIGTDVTKYSQVISPSNIDL
jgi:hypothetical protein